eukprot:COSAG01_NODE_9145_length_2539_cov_1.593852_4_plen_94_part_00
MIDELRRGVDQRWQYKSNAYATRALTHNGGGWNAQLGGKANVARWNKVIFCILLPRPSLSIPSCARARVCLDCMQWTQPTHIECAGTLCSAAF